MSEKKLCYALVYTGSNKKILARTILFYEILSKYTKKDIWIITDSEKNKSLLEGYCKNIYVPKNPEKYKYDSLKNIQIFL